MNPKFNTHIRAIWLHNLRREFHEANNCIIKAMSKKLELVNLELTDVAGSRWGQWNPETRVVSMSLDLLRNYPWSAVTYVFRHELAHAIVNEVFLLEDMNPHGEVFKRACVILKIPYSRCSSDSMLSSMGFTKEDRVMRKVKKLLALGDSPEQEEAERAVAKAHELMMKHNLRPTPSKEAWVARPVGQVWKRMPSYVNEINALLRDYYFVQTIRWNEWDKVSDIDLPESKSRYRYANSVKYMQLFGKPENLDIAEYVFHFLLEEGERKWEEFRQSPAYRTAFRRPVKANYIRGLYLGYRQKVDEQNKIVKRGMSDEQTALIKVGGRILREMFARRFPNRTKVFTPYSPYSRGFGEGVKDGHGITINPGVSKGGQGNLLNS